MPTELTAAPFKHEQQFPYGLEHPRTWAPPRSRPIAPIPAPTLLTPPQIAHSPSVMQWASFGGIGIPPTGPARLVDCVPNKGLPNGVRNPWAPYDGSACRPASGMVENQAVSGSLSGGMIPAPIAPGAPSSWGGAAPTVLPSGSVVGGGSSIGWGGGSVVGGHRIDDGWDGASGRAHMGHLPDATSTAGRLGRSAPTGGGWLQANHARLTPPHFDTTTRSLGGGGAYLQPPVSDAHRPRRLSISSLPIDGCSACASESDKGLRRARSTGSRKGSPGDHFRMESSPVVGSPLRGGSQAKLIRGNSVSSDRSGGSRGSRGRCSECSACA